MADPQDEHHDGPQPDPEERERTFEGFMRLSGWAAIIAILVLIFLALANG